MDGLDTVHADAAIVVVLKPAGLLAVPGRGEAGRDNLATRVQACFEGALVVHRLDMATSGLMLFARSAEMQRRLGAAFAAGRIAKRYVAIVEGLVAADAGAIDAPISADWPQRPRQRVDLAGGKPSLTRWRVLRRLADATRLELEPVTGRTHQLRVHLQSIGHPIRGDALYGVDASDGSPRPAFDRLLLHACGLDFLHPDSGAQMAFTNEPDF